MDVSTTLPALDYGLEMGRAYWRQTVHVRGQNGKDDERCAYCGLTDTAAGSNHREPTPVPSPPIILTVTIPLQGISRGAVIVPSCGHSYTSYGVSVSKLPKLGSAYDCSNCRYERHVLDHPGLPEDIVEAINEAQPKCPECGGKINSIDFRAQTTHELQVEIDGSTGEMDTDSERADVSEYGPETGRDDRSMREGVSVWCENIHHWYEPRLEYVGHSRRGDGRRWRLLPPDTGIPTYQSAALGTVTVPED